MTISTGKAFLLRMEMETFYSQSVLSMPNVFLFLHVHAGVPHVVFDVSPHPLREHRQLGPRLDVLLVDVLQRLREVGVLRTTLQALEGVHLLTIKWLVWVELDWVKFEI